MDIIITALGEFIWAASCAVVNCCLSSGFSVLAVFVSFLCAILASAFYRYTVNREQMSAEDTTFTLVNPLDDNVDTPVIITSSTTDSSVTPSLSEPLTITTESDYIDNFQSLSEIEISIEEDTNEKKEDKEENTNETEENTDETEENNEEIIDDLLIETVEGSEDEIQKQQIANIYRLLNDQHLINNWTTTDFLDQLQMYGLQAYDENELEAS